MKKIDLHVHTKSTASDRPFVFDLNRLMGYVQTRSVDCIAITNHNEFDLLQFTEIKEAVDALVLPGIEIDLEGGQLLMIADGSDLKDFAERCKSVTKRSPNKKNSLSVKDLESIFGPLSKYILIPHYDKEPRIREETLSALGPHVTAGEVSSAKKFMYCINGADKLVPVYFSDCRMEASHTDFPVRQTYVACEETTFAAIKSCLRDKGKVALSASDGNKVFQIFDDGQMLSTGLNVIIGERSSGKSHTLERIDEVVPNAGYIKQFSLVARDEAEDERKFNRFLADRYSLLSRDFLSELQEVANDVIDVDLIDDAKAVDRYLKSLLKHAKESEKHDQFSRARLFSEEVFPTFPQKGLEDLIGSTQNLIENVEFRSVIDRHVRMDSLKKLIVELMNEWRRREQEQLKKKWLNDLIAEVKKNLQVRSASTTIADVDLYKIAMNKVRVAKFESVVRLARKRREIMRRSQQGFQRVAIAAEFDGALDLKKLSGSKPAAFSQAFELYSEPYQYLQKLKEIEGLEEADLYKYFVKIEFKVLNEDGYQVSGGEKSEFNLLQGIEDAQNSDILLIDEPESSFDNIFLKQRVNEIIKALSRSMPVVLVTHNSTVGASIKPDYLLYTSKEYEGGEVKYRIYSGFPSSKRLLSRDGKSMSTWTATMECLEAGVEAYDDRRSSYEDIRDQG
jgi:ABC-type dipeptide/oligopeptide/nickel transport system ATPase component